MPLHHRRGKHAQALFRLLSIAWGLMLVRIASWDAGAGVRDAGWKISAAGLEPCNNVVLSRRVPMPQRVCLTTVWDASRRTDRWRVQLYKLTGWSMLLNCLSGWSLHTVARMQEVPPQIEHQHTMSAASDFRTQNDLVEGQRGSPARRCHDERAKDPYRRCSFPLRLAGEFFLAVGSGEAASDPAHW